jgi:nicotinamide riboside transporter PnuC
MVPASSRVKDVLLFLLSAYITADLYLMYKWKKSDEAGYDKYMELMKDYTTNALLLALAVGLVVGLSSYYLSMPAKGKGKKK